jgi:hypothetical protein
MNFARVALAAVAVWCAYVAVGALVHGVMLSDLWEQLYRDGIIRSDAMAATVRPHALALALPGAFAFAYAYAKGYEGGPGLQEGLRFGVLVGLMVVAFGIGWSYLTFPVPLEFLAWASVAAVMQFAAAGMIAGLIYRPAPPRKRG